MKEIYKNRITKLLKKINENNIEAIILNNKSDVYYLTGFVSLENIATLLITNNSFYFITDGRFINQFYNQVDGFTLKQTSNNSKTFETIKEIINQLNIKSIYFPFSTVSYKDFLSLQIKDQIVEDSKDLIFDLRKIKDENEIEFIKKACQISENSFLELIKEIKEGMTEIEIRNKLEEKMWKFGCDKIAFPTIVASGPENGALPHAIPSNRKIEKGDFITIDFGACFNNYCSDITRTIALGDINKEQMKIYDLVLSAKKESVKKIRKNINVAEVHNVANKIIESASFKFLHGLGHSFGIDIHEPPSLNAKSDEKLLVNEVHTIEPGIYAPGLGGVRIEDDYLITEDGFECLTPNIPTELIKL